MRKYSISMGYLHKYPHQSYQDCHISFYYLIIIETYSNTLNRFKVVFFILRHYILSYVLLEW